MRVYLFAFAALFFLQSNLNAQSIGNNNPLDGKKLLSFEAISTMSHTDYPQKFGGGARFLFENYFYSSGLSAISYRLIAQGNNLFGEDKNIKLSKTFQADGYKTDMINLGGGFSYSYAVSQKIIPYTAAGISLIWFNPMMKNSIQSPNNAKDVYWNYTMSYEIELGAKIPLSEKIILGINFANHWITLDYIDDVLYGENNDAYSAFGVGISYAFKSNRDSDNDGILDKYDACPNEPEDFDGYEDEDGCPDLDNDGDGIMDRDDKCPYDAEDVDGFEDIDGCPDLDNDNDGIPDAKDECPNQAEDFDDFEDNDGCPDLDNDNDGILDLNDKCPTDPEDSDGFEDEDGCPDLDNDGDGILDKDDKCPNAPETFNGFEDEDGCPDSGGKQNNVQQNSEQNQQQPQETQQKPMRVIEIQSDITFKQDATDFRPEAKNILQRIADYVKKYPNQKWLIEGHTDNVSNEPAGLTLRRAQAIKNYLVQNGISAANISVVDRGDKFPIERNNRAYGRMKNRRIVLKRVD